MSSTGPEQRIVINDPHRARSLFQRFFQPRDNFQQGALRQRVEKIEEQLFLREFELTCVPEQRFDVAAALRRAPIFENVLFCGAMQLCNQLHTDDFSKRVFRSHQQSSSLA